jgi:ribosome-binding factor A
MTSRRVEKVQSLLHHALGEILQELKDPRIDGLVTITAIEVTPDLRQARVFLSIFGSDEQQQSSLKALESAKPFLRRELGSRVDLRYSPQLDLKLDRSMAYADQIGQLLKNLPPPAGQ